ncbi:MAG: Protoheme IX farnesyltransferase, mitochondrial [Cirrosporium novae-zelandiae]|nr:MAG: Protoheme IX farnesyltransferase, mitochondrial [Cirrosporium novae-zelandiae]
MLLRSPLSRTLSSLDADFVCQKCLFRIRQSSANSLHEWRRSFSSQSPNLSAVVRSTQSNHFRQEYFYPNGVLKITKSFFKPSVIVTPEFKQRPEVLEPNISAKLRSHEAISKPIKEPVEQEVLPHRRRQKQHAASADPNHIPPDASARLSHISAAHPAQSFRRKFFTFLSLSKPRLSFMVVLTAAASYSLYPVPTLLLPSTTASPSLSTLTLVFLTAGTFLSAASANTLNMLSEPEHDAKMSRTRNRPLVRKLIAPRSALLFALVTGTTGLAALYYGVNPTVAFLGGLNIFVYAGLYTPLKRISVINTWVGAVVGGIPPLMGWTAASGQSATAGGWQELLFGPECVGGWLLASLLFAWQFPHFNALSWTIREEYKNAGYRMLCWVNPAMNARVALRYSLAFFPICFGLWYVGVTDSGFLVTSSITNAWLVKEAWRFYKYEGLKGSARGCFWAGVWQLPLLMVLAMVHKKGLWQWLWRSAVGGEEEEEDDEYYEDEEPEEPLAIEETKREMPTTA